MKKRKPSKYTITPVEAVEAFSAGKVIAAPGKTDKVEIWMQYKNKKVLTKTHYMNEWEENREIGCQIFNERPWRIVG